MGSLKKFQPISAKCSILKIFPWFYLNDFQGGGGGDGGDAKKEKEEESDIPKPIFRLN